MRKIKAIGATMKDVDKILRSKLSNTGKKAREAQNDIERAQERRKQLADENTRNQKMESHYQRRGLPLGLHTINGDDGDC